MKGLPNAGLTCYFNATLQCLAYCPNMTNYILAGGIERDLNVKRKGASGVASAYAAFVRDYWTREGVQNADPAPVYAAFMKACRGFPASAQHDAHEALVCLLDKVHEGASRLKPGALAVAERPEVKREPWVDGLKGSTSVVSEVFRGQLETEVTADGYASLTHDHFTCLSLAINGLTSLGQAIQRHMGPERVTEFRVGDAVVNATLRKRFTYLPRILVVHFKRFDDGADKLDKFIDYATELDLGEFAAAGCAHHYQLFAVCLHHGTATDGHYTACCEVHGRWAVMDDESVTPLQDINHIIQRDAYVLLYKRL